jgi:hypothetical protein
MTCSRMSSIESGGYVSNDIAVTVMHFIATCKPIILALQKTRQSHAPSKRLVFRFYSSEILVRATTAFVSEVRTAVIYCVTEALDVFC